MKPPDARLREVLAWLERHGTRHNRDGMARYGIVAAKAFGVSMTTMRPLVRGLGRDHELATALWRTGWHEARVLAALVDDPARVTVAQMDRWARDFDNWAVCDSACVALFARTPHAWRQAYRWGRHRAEFVKRAAFSLIASLAVHDRTSRDEVFLEALALVEREAPDGRHYVKKGVSWALRAIGKRDAALHAAAVEAARRLAASPDPPARWVGRDALRDLASPATRRRLARRE